MLSTEHRPPLWRQFVFGTLVAAAVATAAWLATQVLGQPLIVTGRGDGPAEVPLGAVLFATLAGGAAGWMLAEVSTRTRRPRAVFLVSVAVGLALSTVPPINAAVDPATAAWLLGLHGLVAAAIVPPLAMALPSRRSAPVNRSHRDETMSVAGRGGEEHR